MTKTRGLSILGYNREIDRLEAKNKLLRDALELVQDELTGEAWLAVDLALKEADNDKHQ